MKCSEFKDNLDCMPTGANISDDMIQHIAECDDCKQYYYVITSLMPTVFPKTPENIKSNVLTKIRIQKSFKNFFIMKNRFSQIAASMTAAAVIAFVIVLSLSPIRVMAAKNIIDRSLANIAKVVSMEMKIDVRTEANENFSYIDISAPLVEHKLTVVMDNPPKWRLDKGGRTIVFDGTSKYMWSVGNFGVKSDKNSNFEEWFNILFNPQMILLQEKVALKDKGTKYAVEETESEIVMTANIKAQGDFTNNYLKNTSIEHADTRREIIFDKNTKLIKSMKIFVKDNSREILVVNVKSIQYDTPVNKDKLTELPTGHEWRNVNETAKTGGQFANISDNDAIRLIVNAVNNNDLESIKEVFINYNFANITKQFEGAKVIRTGKPFKSGIYPGIFVPYEVSLPNGSIKKWNIALRNDNPDKKWVIDGGI